VFRAYYAQLNADLQQRAIALGGGVTYLEDEEGTPVRRNQPRRASAVRGACGKRSSHRRIENMKKMVPACPVCRGHCSRALPLRSDRYPTKPIKLVVPFSPGGASDLTARTLAQKMGESMGQSIVVDNKPGRQRCTGHRFGGEVAARRLHDPAYRSRLAHRQPEPCT
jgi:hypothetical protein